MLLIKIPVTFSLREYVVNSGEESNHTVMSRKAVKMLVTRLYDLQNGSRLSVVDAEDATDMADNIRTMVMTALKVSNSNVLYSLNKVLGI